jgi:hypothetical protein
MPCISGKSKMEDESQTPKDKLFLKVMKLGTRRTVKVK